MSHTRLLGLAFFRTSQVNYGATASYGSSTTKDSKLLTYHEQTITGLSPGTIHHFQVVSVDGSNNSVSSKDVTGLQYRVYRASGTCISPGSFTEIADNVNAPTFEDGGVARGLWCCKVTALVSGQERARTHITVIALSSEHSNRFIGRTHQ